jgi:hypothetical protein
MAPQAPAAVFSAMKPAAVILQPDAAASLSSFRKQKMGGEEK